MRSKPMLKRGFSILELVIVVAIIFIAFVILVAVVLPGQKRKAIGRSCFNNLRVIGIAYRIWSGDHQDRFPQQTPIAEGGWQELLRETNNGNFCATNYSILQNELGQSPTMVTCPADRDQRSPAQNFNGISNANISYFVATGPTTNAPNAILAGDRNLAPGLKPSNDYGYSKPDGAGNDVILTTNSEVSPVCWSLKMHSDGDAAGAGNVLLSDASVKQTTSAQFRSDIQSHALDAGNFPTGYINHSNSFRLIFP